MENLQLVLFVLGITAIIAVLVHGVWSIRRQQSVSLKTEPSLRSSSRQAAASVADTACDEVVPTEKVTSTEINQEETDEANNQDLTQSAFASREDPVFSSSTMQSRQDFGKQASLFAEESLLETKKDVPLTPTDELNEVEDEVAEPNDVLALHVCAKEGQVIEGAELLPCLLTLNFKFGEMNIFHRHEDNAGTGNVLFSLANMVNPGVFDPDNMEQFNTHGVVFFMTLPTRGEPVRNFSIMLNSAFQLADDLNAEVLDGERKLWQSETKNLYLDRIRRAS